MSNEKTTIFDLGYNRNFIRVKSLNEVASKVESSFYNAVNPMSIASGDLLSNLIMVDGYLQSVDFVTGTTGWKIYATGSAEFNNLVVRGTIYATSGTIGGWVIDTDGLYYNGSGDPSIRTSATVEAGDDGVIIDKDGVRVYDSILGLVVNLPSDGSAPVFSSGTITSVTFEINTNSVLRTSETVGDGTANSYGVLINNSGFYACGPNQLLADANVKILSADGDAFFKGTIDASVINSCEMNTSIINGAIITGGLFRTAESGQRIEIDSTGITLLNGETGATYGDATYFYGDADRKYGTGVLAYVNNQAKVVPFYISSEQSVGDFHMVNRSADPTGAAEIGDLCVVDGKLMVCTSAGTPGTWTIVGTQTA